MFPLAIKLLKVRYCYLAGYGFITMKVGYGGLKSSWLHFVFGILVAPFRLWNDFKEQIVEKENVVPERFIFSPKESPEM